MSQTPENGVGGLVGTGGKGFIHVPPLYHCCHLRNTQEFLNPLDLIVFRRGRCTQVHILLATNVCLQRYVNTTPSRRMLYSRRIKCILAMRPLFDPNMTIFPMKFDFKHYHLIIAFCTKLFLLVHIIAECHQFLRNRFAPSERMNYCHWCSHAMSKFVWILTA